MEIQSGIQPNCSEVALIVHPDKMNKKQYSFFNKFTSQKGLEFQLSKKGNFLYEDNDKSNLIDLKKAIEELAVWENIKFKEGEQFELMRDESYYDMKEEGRI